MSRCLRCQHENPAGARFGRCAAGETSGESVIWFALGGMRAKFGAPTSLAQPQLLPSPSLISIVRDLIPGVAGGVDQRPAVVRRSRCPWSPLICVLEAWRLLDPVLDRMMEAVHRYEGTVNQVMGDGIMALFGAPLAHEDHAVRACYAALRMQDTVQPLR